MDQTAIKEMVVRCNLFGWDDTSKRTFIDAIASLHCFFVVAHPETSYGDWQNRQCILFTENRSMSVFFDINDADTYAFQVGSILDGKPMRISCSHLELLDVINRYQDRDLIETIRLCVKEPVSVSLDALFFVKKPSVAFLYSLPEKAKPFQKYPRQDFVLIPQIKEYLNCFEKKRRSELDPFMRFTNMQCIIEQVIFANHLDQSKLEAELSFPSGFINRFCKNKASGAISKTSSVKLLSYFGLEEYLYQFQSSCLEVAREIRDNPYLDQYEIKPARVSTNRRYELTNLRRGLDRKNRAYVYESAFTDGKRQVKLLLSYPIGLTIKKDYEILGVDKGIGTLKKSKAPVKRPNAERLPEEKRKDDMIHFYKKNGFSFKSACIELERYRQHPEILEEFHRYVTKRTFGSLTYSKYTAKKLIVDIGLSPIEAFEQMINLKMHPKEAKSWLKFRENAPQYQNKKQEKQSDNSKK